MLDANPLPSPSPSQSLSVSFTEEAPPTESGLSDPQSFVTIGQEINSIPVNPTAVAPTKQKTQNPTFSASRAIWNSLAVASMITLMGFGLLSLKLSSDLNLAQAEKQVIQNRIIQYESQSTSESQTTLSNQTRINEYQNQVSTIQNQYAALKADQLIAQAEKNRVDRLNASLVEENNRLAELRMTENQRLTMVSIANRAEIMYGTEFAPNLQGAFYLRDYSGLLVIHGLEPLSSEQSYQLWLMAEDGGHIPAAVIPVHSTQEPAWAKITLPQNTPNFVSASVSIEPVGGTVSPTGPMILASEIHLATQ